MCCEAPGPGIELSGANHCTFRRPRPTGLSIAGLEKPGGLTAHSVREQTWHARRSPSAERRRVKREVGDSI